MKAIVTGGAGFIGSHIVDRLISMGVEVIVLDNLSTGKEENINPKAILRHVDISSWDELLPWEEDFKNCDVIFHNAASKKNICLRDPARDMQVNGVGTLMLLQLAEKHNVARFIHASTGSVYGEVKGIITEATPYHPVSYYGVSKLAGEGYVKVFSKVDSVILRYFHVYGPRQESDPDIGGVIAIFKKQIEDNMPITIHGTGDQKRVFTHVNDVVEANIRAWKIKKAKNGIYNCCHNGAIRIRSMAMALEALYDYQEMWEHKDYLPGDIMNFDVDNSLICEDLSMSFTPFKIGINML
jgi:nucleoside-diphosphate-sugar epimerase